MSIWLTLAGKDIRLLLRDKVGLFFTFFFPILYSIFFGLIMGNMGKADSRGIKVGLVDEDGSEPSRRFVERLSQGDALEITQQPSLSEVSDSVRRGKLAAYVRIPPGFGESQRRVFWGDPPSLEVGIDPSRKAEAGIIQGMLTREVFRGIQDSLANSEQTQALIDEALASLSDQNSEVDPPTANALKVFLPTLRQFMGTISRQNPGDGASPSYGGFREPHIEIKEVARPSLGPNIQNAYQITCPQGLIWGIMSCAAAFALSIVIERNSGTLVRLRTAPISRGAVVGGKALGCFLTTLLLAAIILAIFTIGFGVRIHSWGLLITAVISVAACFVGLMILFSVLGKTEQGASGAAWAVLLVMAMLGGGMIPLAFMPPQMAMASHISPVKWSILALEGAIWRGFTWSEMAGPCLILLVVGAVAFYVGERSLRRLG